MNALCEMKRLKDDMIAALEKKLDKVLLSD